MKIQYASDLHLEFPENKAYLGKIPLMPGGDILILAGDIVPMNQMDAHNDFFKYLSDNFSITYWLPGNHEYYHSDMDRTGWNLNESIRENVRIVNNTTVKSGGTVMIFSTLWTKIGPENRREILMRYSDFHIINYKGHPLTILHYNQLHEQALFFLRHQLTKETDDHRVVITHHAPTFLNYPGSLSGDPLNEVFGVELKDLISRTSPDYWIFGHNHLNSGDFKIGNTFMVTNTLGYIRFNEQRRFSRCKVIEI